MMGANAETVEEPRLECQYSVFVVHPISLIFQLRTPVIHYPVKDIAIEIHVDPVGPAFFIAIGNLCVFQYAFLINGQTITV